MAGIRIVPFLGETPRTAERLLGEGGAQDATNLILTSGEIRPIRTPLLINTPVVSGPWLSVYRAEYNGSEQWMAWAVDVDAVKGPLPPSAEARFYWTGDGEPRYAPFSDLPDTYYALGVPNPQTAPTVSPSGGSGSATTRYYCYTFYTALGEESPASPLSALTSGLDDDTWAISGMDAFPANSGTVTGVHASGTTTFTDSSSHWLRTGDQVSIGGDTLTVTVTSTTVFTVSGDYSAETAWSRIADWNTTGMTRRLYRSTGTTGSFQLVDDDVSTSYNDTLSDANILGDELISAGYSTPPTGLQGLRALPNGSLVGFYGNLVYFSEPFQPHAWPDAYKRQLDFEVIGLGSYGTTVVACTAGLPVILTGNDPSVVTAENSNSAWPCLAKRSVVSTQDGVLFATSYGMAYVGLRGQEIWTQNLFTRYEWRPLQPAMMVAASAEGRVFVRYADEDGQQGVLIFDLDNPQIGLTRLNIYPDEIYADQRNGKFYLVDEDGIKEYDRADGARENYSWRSKQYHFASPINFGACKIDFESEQTQADVDAAQTAYEAEITANETRISAYAGIGALNGSYLNNLYINGSNILEVTAPDVATATFTLYSNDVPVFAKQITDDQTAFRLPSGFRSDNWSVGITGTLRIKSVKIAETMNGLKVL